MSRMIQEQKEAGKYKPSSASYCSQIFTVKRKDDSRRIVHDMRSNKVTIKDASLLPKVEEFTEGFIGRQIYTIGDLFSGYLHQLQHC